MLVLWNPCSHPIGSKKDAKIPITRLVTFKLTEYILWNLFIHTVLDLIPMNIRQLLRAVFYFSYSMRYVGTYFKSTATKYVVRGASSRPFWWFYQCLYGKGKRKRPGRVKLKQTCLNGWKLSCWSTEAKVNIPKSCGEVSLKSVNSNFTLAVH